MSVGVARLEIHESAVDRTLNLYESLSKMLEK
jgi:hypothetical protein